MPHGHGAAGENPEEIHVFANSLLRQGKPLARITDQGQTDVEAWATFEAGSPIEKGELAFTRDSGIWKDRKWEQSPAKIEIETGRITAAIPADAKVFYLNLFDDRQCVVSTRHVER
jgi:hypothetical protein